MWTRSLKNLLLKGKIQFEWSSEVYGFGKTFRKMAYYPRFLPIFLTSDHGVGIDSMIDVNIVNGKTRTKRYLTWDPMIVELYQNNRFFKVSGIMHPWVYYKEKMSLSRTNPGLGTIFFPYHTVPSGFITQGISDEESVRYLLSLPKDFQPVTICFHMHDLKTDRPKFFEKHGFEITSVGNMMSFDYTDDFYKLISTFAFSISEDWGTQVAYLVDFGIPCQIIPREIEITPTDPTGIWPEPQHRRIYLENKQKAYDLFADLPRSVSKEQSRFIEHFLGYSFRENSRYMFFWFWSSAVTVGFSWFFEVWMSHAIKFFLKTIRGAILKFTLKIKR